MYITRFKAKNVGITAPQEQMWPKINGNGSLKYDQARRLKEIEQGNALLCRI
tara:strand:- start:168 stop:323 length:156 start_codon:yes stop_codon:yes gene_type:complete